MPNNFYGMPFNNIGPFESPISLEDIYNVDAIQEPWKRHKAKLDLERKEMDAYFDWENGVNEALSQHYQALERRCWEKEAKRQKHIKH